MLVEAILHNAEMDLDLSVERDVVSLRHRFKHEGWSFLTITLPKLADALEQGLEHGLFSCPTNFSRHGSLPRFMGGFFNRVFNRNGELRDDAQPEVVFYIRQICRFFKKLKIACSDKRNVAAVQHFIDVEDELREMTPLIEREDNLLDSISRILWSQVFPEIDPMDLVCHHGPGATAEKLALNERHRIQCWNSRSEFLFPSDLHCYPNYEVAARVSGIGEQIDCVEGPRFLDIKEEIPVRVVFVPKTQTAPRVIAIEPSHVQFTQQSVKDYVYKILEGHSLTKRSIRFTRQDVNQRLARSGSIDKRTSTLDLKDASDRVHLHLVQRIFKNSGLLEYLEDARSLHATLPDGRNIVLFKYASMGSALCFPVEAMVFYTLVQSAMHQLDGRRPSSRSIRNYSRKIAIYGDDIIVPVEYTDVVVRYLEQYALKVNINKSFSKGNFRESCGADYYKGYPVNPVYARTVPHDDSRSWGAETVMSWNATADLFYMRGLWHVAQTIRTMLSRVVRRTIPKSRVLGTGLAHFSFIYTTDLRYDRKLHCWKQKRLVYHPIKRKDNIDGHELACLNKWGQSTLLQLSRPKSPCYQDSNKRQYAKFSIAERVGHPGTGFPLASSEVWGGGSRDSECRMGSQAPGIDTRIDDVGLLNGQLHLPYEGRESPCIRNVAGRGDGLCLSSECQTRPEFDFSSDYCLTEEVQSDPLGYLHGRSEGLDFRTSTKRGCFKSKSRWITLAV